MDPGSGTHAQAVIAVLEAKPNCAGELAALVRRLTPHVRAEPGCLGFIPYHAQTNAGRIYIYEVYADAGAFDAHLQADYVREFIAALPAVTPLTADENPPCNSTSLTEPPPRPTPEIRKKSGSPGRRGSRGE
jgi:quinol monooxygenase YgiN